MSAPTRIAAALALALLAGCAAPEAALPPRPAVDAGALRPSAGEGGGSPAGDAAGRSSATLAAGAPSASAAPRPVDGPLAQLAQAIEEAGREAERARRLEEELRAEKARSEALEGALAARTAERDAAVGELDGTRRERRTVMARLLDAEMGRVRAEQELIRRDIEAEERRRLERMQ